MTNVLLTIVLAFSIQSMAAEVGVKVNNLNANEDTTISIEKGKI